MMIKLKKLEPHSYRMAVHDKRKGFYRRKDAIDALVKQVSG